MFEIRIVTPVVTDESGRRFAGGILAIGRARLPFCLDCAYWSPSAYERQWKAGITRIAEGALSSALVTAYHGHGDESHGLWALWCDDEHVYVQARSVRSQSAAPFDPAEPYAYVPPRVPVGEYAPPPTQWRVDVGAFHASASALGVSYHSR